VRHGAWRSRAATGTARRACPRGRARGGRL